MTNHGELLNSAEVCTLLGIDRSTLTRRVAAGLIPFAKKAPGVRGAYVFHRADVDQAAAAERASKRAA